MDNLVSPAEQQSKSDPDWKRKYVKTHDTLYRHLRQFKQLDTSMDPDDVPEIFFLLVNFFDQNP